MDFIDNENFEFPAGRRKSGIINDIFPDVVNAGVRSGINFNISKDRAAIISWQESQTLQGSLSFGWRFEQFTALAKSRAVVVLPKPRGPENK
ncbi:MAG: hypothetical protein WCX08_02035 [Candidatus Buchananbacteria bacterium]